MRNRKEFIKVAAGLVNFANISVIEEIGPESVPTVFHQRNTYGTEYAISMTETEIRKSSLREFTQGQYGTLVFVNPVEVVSVVGLTDGNTGCNISLLDDYTVWVAESVDVVTKRLTYSLV